MIRIGKNNKSKKRLTLLFAFLLGIIAKPLMAQDQDPWVGEWTSEAYSDIDWEASNATKDANGTIQEVIKANYKLIIRITKNNEHYTVRGKTVKIDDPNYINYHPRFTITKIEDNVMWLEASESKRPYISNGEVDEYSDLTWYYRLTLEYGALHYVHYKTHSINYDRNMIYKNEDIYDNIATLEGNNFLLYNDNW